MFFEVKKNNENLIEEIILNENRNIYNVIHGILF